MYSDCAREAGDEPDSRRATECADEGIAGRGGADEGTVERGGADEGTPGRGGADPTGGRERKKLEKSVGSREITNIIS